LEALAPALAHEAQAVANVKRDKRFTVVMGNPPYSVLSANLTDSARRIVDLYRYVDGVKIVERSMLRLEMHLQDDYVKFMAFSQRLLQQSGVGVLGFITNNGFLDNLTLRGVRSALLQQFNQIFITDLHGNRLRQEMGVADENVFDIEQGVAISVATSTGGKLVASEVKFADIHGAREKKYKTLQQNTVVTVETQIIKPQSSQFFLVPRDDSAWPEFKEFVSLLDVMPVNISGIVTAHDDLVVDFDDQRLIENAKVLRNPLVSVEQARAILSIKDNAGWKLAKARASIKSVSNDQPFLHHYGYRPFDTRRIYYHPALVWSDRRKVMSHVLAGNNVALATCRQLAQTPWEHIFVTRELQDDCFVSNRTRERSYHFPLHLRSHEQQRGLQADLLNGDGELGPNFSKDFIKALSIVINPAAPDSIFRYIYAVLHSPTYRSRYVEFLKIDFPRIPLPGSLPLFQTLATLGGELVALHLLESHKVNDFITRFEGKGDNSIPKKPIYKDGAVWINASQRFEGVPEAAWNFHVGCYQVCEKWLKDRKGRTLAKDDIAHYQKIVVALSETIHLMAEIDKVIETHGGWPDAFTSAAGQVAAGQDANTATDDAIVAKPTTPPPAPVAKKSHVDPVPDLFSTAPAVKPASEPAPPAPRTAHADDYDRDELCAEIRKLFSDGAVRERDAAIDDLARALGHQRTGKNIRETLDNALRTAVRRGILDNESSYLKLHYRNIEQHEAADRDALKEQFFASLAGRAWTERDDAIQSFARWMGFRRTGATIDETVRSLINGLLREHRLESDGSQIRRTG